MKKIVMLVALAAAMACFAYEKKTYRDSNGRIIGVATTDNMGRTTYRDSNGHSLGTASTDSIGRTTYRGSNGQLQGMASGSLSIAIHLGKQIG